MIKKILILLLIALIVIQFFHPKKNQAKGEQPNYIGKIFLVPEDIQSILAKACNDCHSNNTRYPWYSKIQPVDWWLTNHVNEGKREINFDEFANKSLRYQYHKIGEISEQIKEGKMPIKSYTWTHKDAILTEAEKSDILGWAAAMKSSLESRYPMDSLVRKKSQQ